MNINHDTCTACGRCIPWCPTGAIFEENNVVTINTDECVECCLCQRNAQCPTGSLEQPPLVMPRSIRKAFSDPLGKHSNTDLQHLGRGTEEVKTNDVTGLVHGQKYIAMAIEPGRPLLGAFFRDVEKIAMAIAPYVKQYDQNNPLTKLMIDQSKGLFDPAIKNEKVLSCILEFHLAVEDLHNILAALRDIEPHVDCVFSVGVIAAADAEGRCQAESIIKEAGISLDRSTKVNMGLGKPLFVA